MFEVSHAFLGQRDAIPEGQDGFFREEKTRAFAGNGVWLDTSINTD